MEGEPNLLAAHPFVDVHQEWQQGPVSWMVEHDLTTGTTGTPTDFSPDTLFTGDPLKYAAHIFSVTGTG